MKKLVLSIAVLFTIACQEKQENANPIKSTVENNPHGTFDVELQLERLSNDEYFIVTNLSLDGGAYVISPYSKDDTYLPFGITFLDNKHFAESQLLIENPKSVDEIDPILNTPVKFVRENTIYKQKITLNGSEDFESSGLIEFLLEPICIPYNIEFTITSKNGEMSVAKTNTAIAANYYK